MSRTKYSLNKKKFKEEIIRAVTQNDHRAMDDLAYQLQKKLLAEEILKMKGYEGKNILDMVRRLEHKLI